jgi:DNA mismatch repair protein MutL
MGKIKVLKKEVYNKIAAGEVVERPLSVVKELVENSIDSGADDIKIEIFDAGKRSIKVDDNGDGFDSEDIEIAFNRHSTSKLSELSDFDNLNTLGFRGEALPSILEVSKIRLKTSNNNKGEGVYCLFENRELIKKEEIAFNKGTSIEVIDLFYNFPVRRKFLKSNRTELNQIISFVEKMALVNFKISFSLINDNRSILSYGKVKSLKDRIYQVFGKDFLEELQEIDFEQNSYKLNGFVSKLNKGVSLKRYQFFFVNNRPIREKTLIASLNNTFIRYLEKHKSPICILMLEIPSKEVDANIHPQKLEIKFKDSNVIYQLIKRAIDNSFLDDKDFKTNIKYDFRKTPDIGNYSFKKEGAYNDEIVQSQGLFHETSFFEDDFVLIGQYKNSYIIIEKNEELLIIDQHNAHERINFDKLKKCFYETKITSISPLFPIIIEFSESETSRLDEYKKQILEKIGFEMEPLSRNSFDIKKFPQIVEEQNIKDLILSIIYLKKDEINFEDKVLSTIACKSAIKVNHKLYPEEMKKIVRDLFKTSNPYFCPHKRPVIIKFTLKDIEKMLKRK